MLIPTAILLELLQNYVLPKYLSSKISKTRSCLVLLTQLLHVGIGVSVRNAGTLSVAAAGVLFSLYPVGNGGEDVPKVSGFKRSGYLPTLALTAYVTGSVYYNVFEVGTCSQTTSWVPTVMFNRWNVFTSSEEYVTWEVAVGTFNDGRVEDVWRGEGGEVDWRLPDVGGIKKRGGRWRSFQYLAEGTAEQENALWGWICGENEGLVEYEFWMVKAMTERDMGYGGSRKRLVKKWKCEREEETEGRDKGEREGIEEEEKGGNGNAKQNENSEGNDEF